MRHLLDNHHQLDVSGKVIKEDTTPDRVAKPKAKPKGKAKAAPQPTQDEPGESDEEIEMTGLGDIADPASLGQTVAHQVAKRPARPGRGLSTFKSIMSSD